jgi:hypothetical protein
VDGTETGFVQCGPEGNAFVEPAPRFELVVLHREQALSCPNLLPRVDGGACTGSPMSVPEEPCAEDADCTARPFGFCSTVPTDHYPACGCSYGCLSDADCGPDELCECGDPVGLCRSATCAVDADCGGGALCASVPLATTNCTFFPAERGYRCQSDLDECLSDAECDAAGRSVCTFSEEQQSRACTSGPALCP